MGEGGDDEYVAQRNRPVQARKARSNGWTKVRREEFLIELAASCNIVRATALVEMSPSSAYRLRQRDGEFAAQWQAALTVGYERLETALVRRALETIGEIAIEALDERAEPVEKMTVDQAIAILRSHRESIRQGRVRRRKPQPREIATQEETDAALVKRFHMVERHRAANRPPPGSEGTGDGEAPCT